MALLSLRRIKVHNEILNNSHSNIYSTNTTVKTGLQDWAFSLIPDLNWVGEMESIESVIAFQSMQLLLSQEKWKMLAWPPLYKMMIATGEPRDNYQIQGGF